MFLARREFGKVARVYQVYGHWAHTAAREWVFPGGTPKESGERLCGPGHCVVAATRSAALAKLHENDERYVDEMAVVQEVTYGR